MADFIRQLEERALANLSNPSAITDEALEKAASETEEICEGRIVPMFAKLDLGMFRLKVNLKIGISENDEFLYREALKEVRNSPFADDDSETSGFCAVKNRVEQWL